MVESQQPPPPPEDGQQQGLMIPVPQLTGLARLWVQYRPIIAIGARMARQKIPEELDAILTAVAGGDPNAVANLQQMAQGQPQGTTEPPQPQIGQRVLANDEAALAWQLVRVQGLSYRQARDVMAERYGINVAHATVKNYVDEMDAEMQTDRDLRRAGFYRMAFFLTATSVGMFLLGHFLRF